MQICFRDGVLVQKIEMGGAVGLLSVGGAWFVYAPPSGYVFANSGVYLNGLPAYPVVGTALIFIGIPVYFVSLLLRKMTYAESKPVLWIAAYLGGIGVISYLGDQFFIFDNFLQTGAPNNYPVTIQPMGLLNMPWDIVVLVAFGLAMFLWGYRSALRLGAPVTEPMRLPSADDGRTPATPSPAWVAPIDGDGL